MNFIRSALILLAAVALFATAGCAAFEESVVALQWLGVGVFILALGAAALRQLSAAHRPAHPRGRPRSRHRPCGTTTDV